MKVLERWYLYPQGAGPTPGNPVPGSRRERKKKKKNKCSFLNKCLKYLKRRVNGTVQDSDFEWLATTVGFPNHTCSWIFCLVCTSLNLSASFKTICLYGNLHRHKLYDLVTESVKVTSGRKIYQHDRSVLASRAARKEEGAWRGPIIRRGLPTKNLTWPEWTNLSFKIRAGTVDRIRRTK